MDEQLTDNQLVQKAVRGDDDSLRTLFGRHMVAVHRFLERFLNSPADADDVTQETFIRVWKNLKRFDPEKPFRTWAFGIARNAAIDHLRKRKSVPFSAFDTKEGGNALTDNLADDTDLPDEIAQRKQAGEELRQALTEIPPAYREVVLMRLDGELQFDEIGEALHEPVNTVKSRFRRGLAMLKKLLEKP